MTTTAEPGTAKADAVTASPQRHRMPHKRSGHTRSVTIADSHFYVTANPNDRGELGELFVSFGKQGSTLGGLVNLNAVTMSVGLQYGVPLQTLVGKYANHRFAPMGMTDDPDVPQVTSIADYLARRLALDFLPVDTVAELLGDPSTWPGR